MVACPVVRVVPFQPHCFGFGGFELQMIGAMESARQLGLDIQPLDFWRRTDDFDITHVWGFEVAHHHVAHWSRAGNKKIVMSALLAHPSFWRHLREIGARFVSSTRRKYKILPWLSALTVVNNHQAAYATKILGVPEKTVFVIPNIVDDVFFSPPEWVDGFNIDFSDYVLCTGNVCRRKNQLALVRACRRLGVPLLLVGDILNGEEAYGLAVADAIQGAPNMAWIRGVVAGSNILAAAYANCLLFALPSYAEAQPISALEAIAAGKPILLADRFYARQELFKNAAVASIESEVGLVNGLKRVISDPGSYSPSRKAVEQCRRENVGMAYRKMYELVVES